MWNLTNNNDNNNFKVLLNRAFPSLVLLVLVASLVLATDWHLCQGLAQKRPRGVVDVEAKMLKFKSVHIRAGCLKCTLMRSPHGNPLHVNHLLR